ncbi:hypothetical protein [Pleomorphomonas sp. JP5]|uniref:hypothetical protein n=1 Tax=Pleomorphomonas sp. JP5 TaxID=2942998 RepID=UPI002044181F|nr:hypothetical protein [Pleomorphomonas sp. JP5]MCM5557050.1 hypothetical protein [Pleomorphomonas sp. JP5]
MKELKSASGEPKRRPPEKCSCGNGGELEGTHESHPEQNGCSCCCGPDETTDSVLTGAMDK